MSKVRTWMVPALLGVLLAGCGVETAPVARLAAEVPATFALGYPEAREIRLRWEPLMELTTEIDAEPQVFVHLLDADGRLVRTFDHRLPVPWAIGETVEYDLVLSQSAMAPPLAAGTYDLMAGLYNPSDGERWALEFSGEEGRRQAYLLTRVRVPEAQLGQPAFEYRGPWAPVAAGTDQQILASRWLRGEGAIHLAGVGDAGGQLSLRLWLPTAENASQQIQLLGEETSQRLRVASSCGGSEVEITDAGFHQVTLAIDPSQPAVPAPLADGETAPAAPEAGATGCTVILSPNFILITQGDPQPLAVRLQGLYWRAGLDSTPAPGEAVPRVP